MISLSFKDKLSKYLDWKGKIIYLTFSNSSIAGISDKDTEGDLGVMCDNVEWNATDLYEYEEKMILE